MLTPHETLYKKGQNKLQINVNILNLHLDKKKKRILIMKDQKCPFKICGMLKLECLQLRGAPDQQRQDFTAQLCDNKIANPFNYTR